MILIHRFIQAPIYCKLLNSFYEPRSTNIKQMAPQIFLVLGLLLGPAIVAGDFMVIETYLHDSQCSSASLFTSTAMGHFGQLCHALNKFESVLYIWESSTVFRTLWWNQSSVCEGEPVVSEFPLYTCSATDTFKDGFFTFRASKELPPAPSSNYIVITSTTANQCDAPQDHSILAQYTFRLGCDHFNQQGKEMYYMSSCNATMGSQAFCYRDSCGPCDQFDTKTFPIGVCIPDPFLGGEWKMKASCPGFKQPATQNSPLLTRESSNRITSAPRVPSSVEPSLSRLLALSKL